MIGIDGAGKTTLAQALSQWLRSKGHVPEVVSWKSAIAQGGPLAGDVLSSISMAAYKLQFAEAEPADQVGNLRELLAVDSTDRFFRETEDLLRALSVRRNAAHALLSAALVELAGNCYLHHARVLPVVRDGGVVIVESCGFKHVLKNALMAQQLAEPGSALHRETVEVMERASVYFGKLLRPTAGYWVDADPDMAEAWRSLSGVSSTNFENYGLIGAPRDSSAFVAMQRDCRTHFERFARRWGWTRLEMLDRPKESNLGAALDAMQQTLPL